MLGSDPVLIADVGGTNSRFALAESGHLRRDSIRVIANSAFHGLAEAVPDYLASTKATPRRAVFAVAGPIKGGTVHLTNRRGWSFKPDELAANLGIGRIDVVNDFAALARALPFLGAADVFSIGAASPLPETPKLVLGPGTGLGIAALIHSGRRWIAVPSEGGHIELAATTPREIAIHDVLRQRFGRVSAEIVVSGPGLSRIDAAIARIEGEATAERPAGELAEAARAGESRAKEVFALFYTALGRFAGDMAATFVAQGGVYLSGGVAQKTADLLDPVAFRAAFETKWPHEKLLASIPTYRITVSEPALIGCAAIAADGA